jgi:DNA-binding NarL/FixJ family response regulator
MEPRLLLIIDDNALMRKTVRKILKSKFPKLHIKEAGGGQDALTQISCQLPDLILMDIHLPGGNGLKLTRKILNLFPQITIIIFTNHDLPEYRQAAFENGAKFFISKTSLYKDELTGVIGSILAGAT